jgi:hypothetical protein
MGALTLKSFPFELRGWDIEKFESIDPTDGFGSDTRVYLKNNKIIQIEPDYNMYSFNSWLTNKGRQFFDGIFNDPNTADTNINQSWYKTLQSIQKNIYLFEHCNLQSKNVYYTVIVFENLSLEVTSLLTMISHNYSFVKIRRAQNNKLTNDIESYFQLNPTTKKEKLSASTLCVLVNSNPRYEGFQLNLNLRQRFLKGNFKCFNIGSILNLTFPISFLGSTVSSLKSIAEGNHLICQNFKSSNNPIIIFNDEIYRRDDGKNIINMFRTMKMSNVFSKNWDGLNILNSSLNETGIYSTAQFLSVTSNDFTNYGCIYFINSTIDNFSNLKKITELKILNSVFHTDSTLNRTRLILNQNYYNQENIWNHNNLKVDNSLVKYLYIPTNMFYENNETYLNVEGYFKRTTRLVFQKNSGRSNWQIFRKLLKNLNKNLTFIDTKNNNMIFFNSSKLLLFKSYISFHFYAIQNLSNTSYYLKTKNKSLNLYNHKFSFYKIKPLKLIDTKLKYWLDDFFIGGKDNYSQHSIILSNCSKILRAEASNFF